MKDKFILLILICFIFNIHNIFGISKLQITKDSLLNKNHSYLTYYAHTGLKPGISYVFEHKFLSRKLNIKKINSEGLITLFQKAYISLDFQTNLALYYHKKNHIGIHLNEMVVARYKGLMMYEFGAGIGVLQTIYPAKTYQINDNGTFNERIIAGRTYITNILSCGLGVRISKKSERYLFGRPSVYLIYPYNNFLNVGYSFETGLFIKL